MKRGNSIARVPEILWIQIYKYLDIKTFINLEAVCKILKEYSTRYIDIYKYECLRFTSASEIFRVDPSNSDCPQIMPIEVFAQYDWKELIKRKGLLNQSWNFLFPDSKRLKETYDSILNILKGNMNNDCRSAFTKPCSNP